MTPERWQQVDRLLEQALEQEPDRRGVFLDEACQGDAVLRREVESLLSSHGKAGDFIEAGPLGAVAGGTSAAVAQPLMGRQVGHYQILSRLGEGGMGIVYKARDQHLDRLVAIKVLPPELVADPDRKKRFAQEAKAASALNHPNIITIHDIASDGGTDFIVMEYVQGKTLGQLIPRRGLKLNEVLKYAIQIADALGKAQAAGIIHRDLKPGNIMVGDGGLVKVLDFGLAKLTERPQFGEDELTGTMLPRTDEETILGTASYMSPEQAAGKPVDARSDIFSFGSVLYEMATGQRAFQGDSKMSTLAAVLNQDPKPASKISRVVPHDLEKIINRCLRKEPTRRFQHMADLKVALEELKEESDSWPLGVKEGTDSLGKPSRVSTLKWVGVAMAAIALGAAVWFWLGRSGSVQPESSLTALPLTTYPGWEFSPSFSPDGSQVAFAWSKAEGGDDADIYIKQIGAEEPFRLTDNPAPDVNPAWSRDGRSIAFRRYLSPERIAYIVKSQRGGRELMVADFDLSGSESDDLTSKCAWTPDSKSLVVVGQNAPEEPAALFLVSIETGERRKLTDPPARFSDTDPAISLDGRALVFCRRLRTVRSDLYRLNLSEDMKPQGEPARLTFDNLWNGSATWISREHEIAFISGHLYGGLNLLRMAASESARPQQLAFAGDRVGSPDISRQGNRLVYSTARGDTNIWRIEVPSGKPKQAVKFIASTRDEMEPAYSPDGSKIAFMSKRSGSSEIWVCDSDSSHPVQLTSFGGPLTNRPRWSPDGQQVVFYSDARGNRDIYVMRPDSSVTKPLTTHPGTDTNAGWSADGKWIYFSSDRSGRLQRWKLAVDGGEAVPVPGIRGGMPVESPDGKFLYYDKGWPSNYSIWRVPTSGGTETQVVDSVHPEGGWVVVGKGVYFISKPDERGVPLIRFKDLDTGSIRTIAPIEGRVHWGFAVSPDQQTFLYSQFDDAGSDLMLVENFR